MTTAATPQIGDIRFRNGQWEQYAKDVLPGKGFARSDGWVPFDLSPDIVEVLDFYGYTEGREGEDGLEFSDGGKNWYTVDELQADFVVYQQELELAGPPPQGWVVPWPPRLASGNVNWTQVQSARAAEPEAEPPFFEAERAQEEARQRQAASVTSLTQLAARAAADGDLNKARMALDLQNRPSPLQVFRLAMEFADNEAALKTIFAFARTNKIQLPGVTFPEDEEAASPFETQEPFQPVGASAGLNPTGITWNAATGQWERTAQSAIGKLGEIDRARAAKIQTQLDPFSGGPPVADFPGMSTPDEALAAAIGGESGPIPLPVLPGQQQKTAAPFPGEVTFGTGENAITIEEAQKLAEADKLEKAIQSGGLLAPAESPYGTAQQQPGVGQVQLFNPVTGDIQIGEASDLENLLAQRPDYQVSPGQTAQLSAPPKAPKPAPVADPFEQFRTQLAPFRKPKPRQPSPFSTRPFAVR